MTVKEKLEEQFKQFSLKPVDRTSNLAHFYADFYEIEALLLNGDEFTSAEFINRFKGKDLKPKDLFDIFRDDPDSPAESNDSLDAYADQTTPAEEDDAFDAWAAQVIKILEHRRDQFDADYPFDVDSNSLSLRETLSVRQKIYIFLLLCANLNYFDKLEPKLTSEFEQLSFEVLKAFLSDKAVVKQLGKNSDFKGTAQVKLRALANEMGIDVKEKEFRKIKGNQERGLDVIGWIPFKDRYACFSCFLGQCACGKNWFGKQNETRRFQYSYFDFGKLMPTHVLFIPSALFFNDDFYQSDEITHSLVFERFRLLEFIEDTIFFDSLDSREIVEYCISHESDLV